MCIFLPLSGPIYKVHCFPKEMRVEIVKTDDIKSIYLEHLKEYPGKEFCFFLSFVSV